jgi:selenocysteine lyase/cysteine desulfurase
MQRRQFVQSSAVAAALFGVPAKRSALAATPLPEESLFAKDQDKWWKRVREEQLLLPGWRAFLNNGSLGVAPKPVIAAVTDFLNRSAALTISPTTDDYPRWGYETLDAHRDQLAAFYGCQKDELAITHNATAAMCIVANGLDLRAGDEVILTDQEHPSGRGCWQMKQARYGVVVREVKLPLPPKSSEELADILISAIGRRTKVISFSGITSPTGLILPIRQICDAARAKGVLTLVDGAHMHGQIPFKISELHCDFMAGSPHKWAFAPAGCGLLYLR